MLAVHGLEVRYGATAALAGIDLTIADGEVVSVLGPSGCGKSTLLRAIAGLEPVAAGTITWDDVDLAPLPPHRRQLGLMFQDHMLFAHRDVLGNVAFGLQMRGLPRARVDHEARAALARVGLDGFEHRRITQLSGGEQQRVALARALAPAPRLLMLDEPLGSLDRPLRERLMTELREVLTGLGLTTLYVTHDLDEAFALGDRVAVMQAGRFEQVSAPTEVWRHPATPFVAGFLGYNLTAVFGTGPAAVRPDDVRLTADGPVGAVVEVRAFRRDHFLLRVRLADGDALDVAVRDEDAPDVGAAVRLAVDQDALVRF